MDPAPVAAAAAASAAKHAVCAMAKAQQKAKAKIRWAQHKQEQFLESPFFAELVVPAQEQRWEMNVREGLHASGGGGAADV